MFVPTEFWSNGTRPPWFGEQPPSYAIRRLPIRTANGTFARIATLSPDQSMLVSRYTGAPPQAGSAPGLRPACVFGMIAPYHLSSSVC